MQRLLLLLAVAFTASAAFGQSNLYIDTTIPTETMIMDFFDGACVNITNVTCQGDKTAQAYFESVSTDMELTAGILLATGPAENAIGPNTANATGNYLGADGDADLDNLVTLLTNDAAVVEFDLVSTSTQTLLFSYVFASEEYPEFVCSPFNDVFGFFVDGPNPTGGTYTNYNIALVPSNLDPANLAFTNLPVAINSVNNGPDEFGDPSGCISVDYGAYYVDNTTGVDLEYDGRTVALYAPLSVLANETYHIKIAVADVADGIFDSAVFLDVESLCGDSLVSPVPEVSFTLQDNTLGFVNASRYATSYLWDFGDGTTSTERHPAPHEYIEAGNYTVSLTIENYCCSDTYTIDVPVGDILPTTATLCLNEAYDLEGSPLAADETGSWTILVGTGTVSAPEEAMATLMDASLGTNILTWQRINTQGDVVAVDTVVVQVEPVPQAEILLSNNNFMCTADAPITVATATSAAGQLSGAGIVDNLLFDPALAGPGSHEILLEVTNTAGCTATDQIYIVVVETPSITFTTEASVTCPVGDPILLTVMGDIGSYDGTGVVLEPTTGDYYFHPQLAGVGDFTIYAITAQSLCAGIDSLEISVVELPEPAITTNVTSVCQSEVPLDLLASPAGGTFSGPGIVDNAWHTDALSAGTYPITYTYTLSDGCTDSVTVQAQVRAQPPTPEIIYLDTDSLFATVAADFYTWTLDGNTLPFTSQTIPFQGTGTYGLTILVEGCASDYTEYIFTVDATDVHAQTRGLYVTPNPTSGQIVVHTLGSWQQAATVRIYDSYGRLLEQWNKGNTDRTELDTSSWPAGVYRVVIGQSDRSQTVTFVKL